ncbi:MAG: 50S ribosomal protein L29 [Candidatus Nomurabacteria bacterium]|nr:50S ribosomal protein L29 [Candidatus Nomurabacteria bacterium]
MAKKEKENLKGMKLVDLQKSLSELRDTLRTLRFKAQGSKSKNVKEEATTKKQIARVMTEITAKSK